MLRELLAVLVLAAPQVACATPVELMPSGPWHVDYSRDSCNLLRDFRDDSGVLMTLKIQQYEPHGSLEVGLIGEGARFPSDYDPVEMTFQPGGKTKTSAVSFSEVLDVGGKATPAITADGANPLGASTPGLQLPPAASPAQLAAMTEFTVTDLRAARSFDFQTGPLDQAFAALDACTADLVRHWGLDPAQQRTLTRPTPKGDPGGWVTTSDYPYSALVTGISASVHVRMMIGVDGKLTDCKVQDVHPAPVLGDHTCALLMKRARFHPAHNATGAAVPSFVTTNVYWFMPQKIPKSAR